MMLYSGEPRPELTRSSKNGSGTTLIPCLLNKHFLLNLGCKGLKQLWRNIRWSTCAHVQKCKRRLTSMGSEMPLADAVKVSLNLLHAMRPHGLTLPSLGRPGWLP